MQAKRAAGILLHPTSLPSPFGIGDLGPEADAFLDFLVETGQHWWQVLPLGPTGAGNSPYQSHSSFAGNPLLLSPERMADDGFLERASVDSAGVPAGSRVDFSAAAEIRERLLREAFARFDVDRDDFGRFRGRQQAWLDDFALYMALKREHGGSAWNDWEPDLATRKPAALDAARERLAQETLFHQFVQFLFARQWSRLRDNCRTKNIRLIGDLPIYVAGDSADVWANPGLFELDDQGNPTLVAGVPPDIFNPTDGQRWGNPIYRWPAHKAEGYAWWIERLRASLACVDLLRLDHFLGFEAYWEIPASSPTAAVGRWVKGPGADFLSAARDALGGLPLIAEDLGIITPEVEALRDGFGLPGMKVLQFAFGGGVDSAFLPHHHIKNCVVYTGTHDNDTSVGWLNSEQYGREHRMLKRYVGPTNEPTHWSMNRLALMSVADTAILPLQDVLGLDASARMNTPGEPNGHWGWRLAPGGIPSDARDRLAELTFLSDRWNGAIPGEFWDRPAPV